MIYALFIDDFIYVKLLRGLMFKNKFSWYLSTISFYILLFGFINISDATTINFDIDQASFIAPAASTGNDGGVVVTDQFSSLGVLFSDYYGTTGEGIWVRNSLYGGSSPNVAYSYWPDWPFHDDTMTRIVMDFVDPLNSSKDGYVTSISGFWTDPETGSTLTAFDKDGNQIGQVMSQVSGGNGETLSLSGIGYISKVEWYAADHTGLDNLIFSDVMAYSPVPEPATFILFSIGLLGITGVGRKKRTVL